MLRDFYCLAVHVYQAFLIVYTLQWGEHPQWAEPEESGVGVEVNAEWIIPAKPCLYNFNSVAMAAPVM